MHKTHTHEWTAYRNRNETLDIFMKSSDSLHDAAKCLDYTFEINYERQQRWRRLFLAAQNIFIITEMKNNRYLGAAITFSTSKDHITIDTETSAHFFFSRINAFFLRLLFFVSISCLFRSNFDTTKYPQRQCVNCFNTVSSNDALIQTPGVSVYEKDRRERERESL